GGGTGDPCDITFPHSNANGTGNTQTLLFADDFEIAADVTMTVSNVSFRMFNNIGVASTLAFYQDNGGQPAAAPIYTYSNLTPDSQTVVDSNFGMNIYDIAFTLPTAAELTEGVYWFALQTTVGTDNATNYWTITGSGFGQPGKYTADGGVTWVTNSSSFNFSFTLDGTCETSGGGGQDCDALFTANAAAGTANGFAGVTFDIVNETSEEMTITGFKVPVSGSNSSFDMDIYYTTTASSNVGVHQDPSAWTLLESKTEIPAQNAVPFDPSTFSQVDLNNTLVLQPGQSKGIYLFVTDYGEGNTYRYSNGNYTETDGTITILSNGYGSNATVFSSGFANRAFVGEVQYCTGEGGGGTGSPCSQEYMTGSDPLSSPNGAGITGGNRVANDVIVAANDSFTVQKVTVPVIYLNGSPTTFNVQFYEDDGSGSGGIGADLGPAISYGAGDYTSTFLGNWAGAYPLYMVELPIPDVLLENNSSSDAHFWIVIDGAVSTTGDFGYIVEFNHDGNPSHHTLQYLASSSSWIVYNDPNDMEAYM
ncbi:MAG: hypothetical protein H3C36_15360, partial [Chitinophagaceae bacterium]|nr:hypothetical protein [Chitinophagaceae bacterium]